MFYLAFWLIYLQVPQTIQNVASDMPPAVMQWIATICKRHRSSWAPVGCRAPWRSTPLAGPFICLPQSTKHNVRNALNSQSPIKEVCIGISKSDLKSSGLKLSRVLAGLFNLELTASSGEVQNRTPAHTICHHITTMMLLHSNIKYLLWGTLDTSHQYTNVWFFCQLDWHPFITSRLAKTSVFLICDFEPYSSKPYSSNHSPTHKY